MKVSLALGACVVLVACTGDIQATGDALAADWTSRYTDQVVAVSFENNPPLDPATLFVDLKPSMTSDEQLAFLCDELRPRASEAGIDVTVTYGWHSADCP